MSILELRNVSFSYGRGAAVAAATSNAADAAAATTAVAGKAAATVAIAAADKTATTDKTAGKSLISNYNFAVESHERVALSAPSGFGKTTMCRLLAGYLQPQEGEVLLDGEPLSSCQTSVLRNKTSIRYHCSHGDFYASAARAKGVKALKTSSTPFPVQLIWQHPEQTLDPLLRIQSSLEEAGPLDHALLEKLGIKQKWLSRFPRELSGGELQRCCIARALRVRPKFLIADEISTMLDAITQVQIWDFLLSYCEENEVGLVLVTHSEALQNRLATRVVNLADL
ncbi:MAG: ATP-binding cassette domain-containing protein [Eggerthellaceae bacterium]|nr:ATP-binding cassette domain-containing protein [Eggerthellaceae bacterium]